MTRAIVVLLRAVGRSANSACDTDDVDDCRGVAGTVPVGQAVAAPAALFLQSSIPARSGSFGRFDLDRSKGGVPRILPPSSLPGTEWPWV
jgi:hypothetical protein